MFGVGIANGKFGELLQGALPGENKYFLVSLPILQSSVANFYCDNLNKKKYIYPIHKKKSAFLVKKIMDYFGLSCGWKLTIKSDLKEGKGLGASTADMVACARAITKAIQKELPINVLLEFLKEIEPSDGVMFEEVVCFYHRNVVLHSQLGYLPELMIVGIDEGGCVDTIKFNQNLRPYSVREKEEYATLLDELLIAIKNKNFKHVGKVSTRSAILNQTINPKKQLSLFIEICVAADALGIIVAHSGTYIGIILNKMDPNHINQLSFIEFQLKRNFLQPVQFNTFSNKFDYLCLNEKSLKVKNV